MRGNRCNICKGLALCPIEHRAQQTGAFIVSQVQHGLLACLQSTTDIVHQELPSRVNTINALKMMPWRQWKLIKSIQPWTSQNSWTQKEFSKRLGYDVSWNPENNSSSVFPEMYLCSEHNCLGDRKQQRLFPEDFQFSLLNHHGSLCKSQDEMKAAPSHLHFAAQTMAIYFQTSSATLWVLWF